MVDSHVVLTNTTQRSHVAFTRFPLMVTSWKANMWPPLGWGTLGVSTATGTPRGAFIAAPPPPPTQLTAVNLLLQCCSSVFSRTLHKCSHTVCCLSRLAFFTRWFPGDLFLFWLKNTPQLNPLQDTWAVSSLKLLLLVCCTSHRGFCVNVKSSFLWDKHPGAWLWVVW